MGTRKLKVLQVSRGLNENEIVIRFSRNLNSLEVEGFKSRVQGKFLTDADEA